MLYTSVQPNVVNQSSTLSETAMSTSSTISVDTKQSSPSVVPSKVFHVGIPSPPSEGLEVMSQNQLHFDTAKQLFNGNSGDSDSETRIQNDRLPIGFSPNRSEIDSPSKWHYNIFFFLFTIL